MYGAIWVAHFPDGSVYHRGVEGHRDRQRLPTVTLLRDRLVQIGGPGYDCQLLFKLGGRRQVLEQSRGEAGTITVTGLAQLSTRDCVSYTDVLTNLSRESLPQHVYHNMANDVYEVFVELFAGLEKPGQLMCSS